MIIGNVTAAAGGDDRRGRQREFVSAGFLEWDADFHYHAIGHRVTARLPQLLPRGQPRPRKSHEARDHLLIVALVRHGLERVVPASAGVARLDLGVELLAGVDLRARRWR